MGRETHTEKREGKLSRKNGMGTTGRSNINGAMAGGGIPAHLIAELLALLANLVAVTWMTEVQERESEESERERARAER